MKEMIHDLIVRYVAGYQTEMPIKTKWKQPLTGFADIRHPQIRTFKELIKSDHFMPEDIVENPTVIICYFIPFENEIGNSNIPGRAGEPSDTWARAYKETNEMMAALNQFLVDEIRSAGFRAAFKPNDQLFSDTNLKSRWSHRHFAYLAGLGTFGINNMMITKNGCCGRINSIVADIPVEPDQPLTQEKCLYKAKGVCQACINRCTEQALTLEGFDRQKCSDTCDRTQLFGHGICGKCVVNLPCTYKDPIAPCI